MKRPANQFQVSGKWYSVGRGVADTLVLNGGEALEPYPAAVRDAAIAKARELEAKGLM